MDVRHPDEYIPRDTSSGATAQEPARASPARVAGLALALGLAADLLLRGHAIGVNVLVATGLLVASAALVRRPGRPIDRLDAWLPVAALAFAAFPALRTDEALVVVDTLAAAVLAGAWIAAAAGAAVTRRSLLAGLALAVHVLGYATGGATSVLVRLRTATNVDLVAARGRRFVPIARGLLIGLPLLAVFAGLFSLADPIFAQEAGRVFGWRPDLGELPARVAVVAAVAWVAAGVLWLVASGDIDRAPRSLGAAAVTPGLAWPALGLTEAMTVLIVLDLLFGAFAALQIAYLFGGLDTISAVGLTYAEYARRGFFELLLVGFLAGAVVGGLEATITPRSRRFVVALLVLVALTGVVIVSSLVRLRIYQEAYGWTELRFWVLASIGFLGVSFAAAGLLVATDRSRWLAHAVAAAGVVTLVAINLLGPQAFVTDRNLDRALHPELIPPDGEPSLDAAYLGRLDADAVPALVAALPALDEPARSEILASLLAFRHALILEDSAGDLAAWNLARERARDAVRALAGR